MWAFFIAIWGFFFLACSGGKIKECPPSSKINIPKTTKNKLQTPKKMILLLDYSGSMLPGWKAKKEDVQPIPNCTECSKVHGRALGYYYYKSDEFSSHIAKWLDAATPSGTEMKLEIVLFNKGIFSYNPKSKKVSKYKKSKFALNVGSASKEDIKTWIDGIPDNPFQATKGLCGKRKCPDGTHTKEAIQTLTKNLKGDTILWLFTDNIIDTPKAGNSTEAKRNKEFYDYINKDSLIHMIKAYPTNQKKDCSWMCGSSLFTYGMYLSKSKEALFVGRKISGEQSSSTDAAPKGLLWNPALQELASANSCSTKKTSKLTGIPVRLKPIDDNVLSISIGKPKCPKEVSMDKKEISCKVNIEIQNNLHHQIVETAKVLISNENLYATRQSESGTWEKVSWIGDVCPDTVKIQEWTDEDGKKHSGKENILLHDLKPRSKVTISTELSLPNVTPQHQSFGDLIDIATTEYLYRNGKLIAKVTDIKTKLALNEKDLECVYGAKDLPKIFRDSEQSKPAYALHDIPFLLKNNGKLLAIALLGSIGLGTLVTILVLMRFQRKYYELIVDGTTKAQFALPRISSKAFGCENDHRNWLKIKRGWQKATLTAMPGFIAIRKDDHWELYPADEEDNTHNVSFREGWDIVSKGSGAGDMGFGDDDGF